MLSTACSLFIFSNLYITTIKEKKNGILTLKKKVLSWAFFTCLDRGKKKGGLTAAEPTPHLGVGTPVLCDITLGSFPKLSSSNHI